MFPLGSVVFPFTAVPLRIFEPRYQQLLDSVLDGDRRFGIVLIERGFEVGGGDARFEHGTIVEVVATQDLDDGHRVIVVAGAERLRVRTWLEDDPHPWAIVDKIPFGVGPAIEQVDRMAALVDRVFTLASELGADVLTGTDLEVSDDPLAAAYQLAAMAPLAELDDQTLLGIDDASEMVERACVMLAEQAETLAAQLGSGS
jgi:Lon protease-like protein